MISPKWSVGNYHAVPQEEQNQQFEQYPRKGIYDGSNEELGIPSFPSRLRQTISGSWAHWAAHLVLSFLLLLVIITSGFRGLAADLTRCHMIRPAEGFNTPTYIHLVWTTYLHVLEFYQNIRELSRTELVYLGETPDSDKEGDKWKGHPNRENDRLWQTLGDGKWISP